MYCPGTAHASARGSERHTTWPLVTSTVEERDEGDQAQVSRPVDASGLRQASSRGENSERATRIPTSCRAIGAEAELLGYAALSRPYDVEQGLRNLLRPGSPSHPTR